MLSSRDRWVGTATGWTAGVRFPVGARDFSLLQIVQTVSGAHLALYPMGTIKRRGQEWWSYTSTPQHVFVAWCLIILLFTLQKKKKLSLYRAVGSETLNLAVQWVALLSRVLRSRPGDRPSWFRFLVVFLSPSRPLLSYGRFLRIPFSFVTRYHLRSWQRRKINHPRKMHAVVNRSSGRGRCPRIFHNICIRLCVLRLFLFSFRVFFLYLISSLVILPFFLISFIHSFMLSPYSSSFLCPVFLSLCPSFFVFPLSFIFSCCLPPFLPFRFTPF
jgi:hypothetical protein